MYIGLGSAIFPEWGGAMETLRQYTVGIGTYLHVVSSVDRRERAVGFSCMWSRSCGFDFSEE
jgi:hypothetical protein